MRATAPNAQDRAARDLRHLYMIYVSNVPLPRRNAPQIANTPSYPNTCLGVSSSTAREKSLLDLYEARPYYAPRSGRPHARFRPRETEKLPLVGVSFVLLVCLILT